MDKKTFLTLQVGDSVLYTGPTERNYINTNEAYEILVLSKSDYREAQLHVLNGHGWWVNEVHIEILDTED